MALTINRFIKNSDRMGSGKMGMHSTHTRRTCAYLHARTNKVAMCYSDVKECLCVCVRNLRIMYQYAVCISMHTYMEAVYVHLIRSAHSIGHHSNTANKLARTIAKSLRAEPHAIDLRPMCASDVRVLVHTQAHWTQIKFTLSKYLESTTPVCVSIGHDDFVARADWASSPGKTPTTSVYSDFVENRKNNILEN